MCEQNLHETTLTSFGTYEPENDYKVTKCIEVHVYKNQSNLISYFINMYYIWKFSNGFFNFLK